MKSVEKSSKQKSTGDIFFKYGFLKKLFEPTDFAKKPLLPGSVEVSQDFIEGSMVTKLNYSVVSITLNMANLT